MPKFNDFDLDLQNVNTKTVRETIIGENVMVTAGQHICFSHYETYCNDTEYDRCTLM